MDQANFPIVSLEGLVKGYKGRDRVLRSLSLTIHQGESVALIGANGAGKSTLLKCIAGLHTIDDGSVTSLGETFREIPDQAQRTRMRLKTGFVFQKPSLVARLSVLSNVIHGLLGRSGAWRGWHQAIAPATWRLSAMKALDKVKLSEKAHARADQLSGGQAQRVAIARALVRNPALLIADEPTASLDPVAGEDVMRQFSSLAKENGITLIYTTHDMDHALRFSDRVIALKEGQIFIDQATDALSTGDLDCVFDA